MNSLLSPKKRPNPFQESQKLTDTQIKHMLFICGPASGSDPETHMSHTNLGDLKNCRLKSGGWEFFLYEERSIERINIRVIMPPPLPSLRFKKTD